MKKRYRLKKEIKQELIQIGMEAVAIITMAGIVYMLTVLNTIIF